MTRYMFCTDADESILHSIEGASSLTQSKADLLMDGGSGKMAIFYRPNLFEFLMFFVKNAERAKKG